MSLFEKIVNGIQSPKEEIVEAAQHKMNMKTKPLGALGILEELALKMCRIQNSLMPEAGKGSMFVFAGDHGIARENVSAFPQEVTRQMVLNFLNGGAAINVLCNHYSIPISVVDMGVNFDFQGIGGLIHKKVGMGTGNFLREQAMSHEEARLAVERGMEVFLEAYEKHQLQIIGLGEMGIGNTTSASAIISAATGRSVEEVTGRGTGIEDSVLSQKIKIIKEALKLHKPAASDGIDILAKVGGFEIAGIAGAILAAASKKVAVVLDGIISTAGGLIAALIAPAVKAYCFSGHQSVELGQVAALHMLGIKPVIDFNMRLGEGTGAAICMDIIEASCRIMRDMASFEEAGVSEKV